MELPDSVPKIASDGRFFCFLPLFFLPCSIHLLESCKAFVKRCSCRDGHIYRASLSICGASNARLVHGVQCEKMLQKLIYIEGETRNIDIDLESGGHGSPMVFSWIQERRVQRSIPSAVSSTVDTLVSLELLLLCAMVRLKHRRFGRCVA